MVMQQGERGIEHHARTLVRAAIAQGMADGGDAAQSVQEAHERMVRTLHRISLARGSEAMATAATYAEAAIASGSIYAGSETEHFLEHVAAGARETARDLARGSSF